MGEQRTPSRWLALAALIPLGPFVAAGAFASGEFQSRLYFAGTPARWLEVAATADHGDARIAFALDLIFATSFAIVGYLLLQAGFRHWAPDRRRRFGLWKHAPTAAVVAGVLDLIETSGQFIWLDSSAPPSIITHLIAAIAWWKWLAYVAALIGLFGLVLGPLAAPVLRPLLRNGFGAVDVRLGEIERPAVTTVIAPDAGSLGICASGGGIRSATVMIGAMRSLHDGNVFQQARWLHAVSGGGYAAGGWRASSHVRGDNANLFAAQDRWFRSVRVRRRYLDNGWGSLVGGILGAIFRTTLMFGGVLAATALVGWTAGRLTRSWALHDEFSNGVAATTFADLLAWRLVLPGAIPLACAGALFIASRTTSSATSRAKIAPVTKLFAVGGAVLLVLLVAVPIGIRYGRPLLASPSSFGAEGASGLLGLLSVLGLVAAVRQLLTAELKKRWSRLGGVALATGLFVFAGKVADDQANLDRLFRGGWVPLVALLWLFLLELPPSHRLTLNGVYRKRLAETFCLSSDDGEVPVAPLKYADEPPWSAYQTAAGPELVLCGTAHATKLQFGGLPALGFTFRPKGVTLHDGASAPWVNYPSGSWWDGYPRGWIVSRSMALTGAAFASAMGRKSFGTTNSLLAAANLRLGMWVPNPKFADWFADRDTSPRVHLGYFAKELFNRYRPEQDAFLYVADGGHRENLGMVEQLRERPTEMIVLDASGDKPGSFNTLKQAIELAGVELGIEVDVDFSTIEGDDPTNPVARGTITYADGGTAALWYAKAQLSDAAPIELRHFAAANPPFPDYSTGDQYLAGDEFDNLVALGVHIGEEIIALRNNPVVAGTPDSPD